MPAFPVVLDACVLFNAPVRDTLLRAAEYGLYRVHWSQQILEDTTKNLIASGKMNKKQAEHFVTELSNAFPEALVTVPETQVKVMKNHPEDRYVAACAVCATAKVITTFNIKHFKTENLSEWSIEAQHPDSQLCYLFELASDAMIDIIAEQAADLSNFNVNQLLNVLEKHVPRFVSQVKKVQ